jgi:hypothetical protein
MFRGSEERGAKTYLLDEREGKLGQVLVDVEAGDEDLQDQLDEHENE